MNFSNQFLDEVRARNDIIDVISRYTSLTRRGSGYVGLCPFHNEKTPSFSVSQDKQFFHCFGCGVGGDVITFMMKIENLDFPDAVANLAQRAGIAMPAVDENVNRARVKRERLIALMSDAARFFHKKLMEDEGRVALQYLNERGLAPTTQRNFGLGFAPNSWDSLVNEMVKLGYTKSEMLEVGLVATGKNGSVYDRFRNRIMFPIIDVRGAVIAFGGRVMDDSKPKYLNSPETPIFNKRRNLFALNFAKKTSSSAFILAEGYMDVIALHQAGFDCAVASLGTSLTEEQVGLISRYKKEVIIAYDSDGAGTTAAERAIELLKPAGISVRVLRMNNAKDPDEYIKKFGRERFAKLLTKAETDSEYKLVSVRTKHDLSSDEGRIAYLREAVNMLAKISSPIEREVYIARVAEDSKVTTSAIKLEVERAYKKLKNRAERQYEHQNLTPTRAAQPRERSIKFANARSAIAEEGVIAILVARSDWIDEVKKVLAVEDFSSEQLAAIYSDILHRSEEGDEVCEASVLGGMSAELASHMAGVFVRAPEASADALHDYIETIKVEKAKSGDDALLRAAQLYREKKSYGG